MSQRLHALELRIPPPLVAIAAAGLAYALTRLRPEWTLDFRGHHTLAALLVVAGVVLALLGIRAFRAAHTTVHPLAPEKSAVLVTSGIFRLSRNPMYLGILLGLLGFSAWQANPLALLAPLAFHAWIDRFQIAPEERILAAKFGAAFREYLGSVRRWI